MKTVALIAHDNQKSNLVEWSKLHKDKLAQFTIWATGTTGTRIEEATQLTINKLKSGPLGGDQQIGAGIAEGKVDAIFFFMDPLSPHPHDVDVKALLRIAVVYDVPMALNRSTANEIIKGL